MRENNGFLQGIRVWALALGCIIGWGAFVMPGTTFLKKAGPVGTTIGIIIATALVLIIAVNYSFMTRSVPGPGGSYLYAKSILGYDHGFLAVWSIELAYLSLLWANSATFTMLARYIIGSKLQWGFHYIVADYDVYLGETVTAAVMIVIFAVILCYLPRLAALLRTLMGATLFLTVVLLFTLIVVKSGGLHMVIPAWGSNDTKPIVQIIDIVVLAPWLFVGFEVVTHLVGQIRLKARNIFVAAALAIISGMIIYIFLVLIAASTTPEVYSNWSEYIDNVDIEEGLAQLPVFYSANKVLGTPGFVLVCVAAFCALSTSVLGFSRAIVRILQMMANDGLVPKSLGEEVNGVQRRAYCLVVVISLPILFLGRTAIGWNADVATLSVSIVYAYISVCAYMVAKKNGNVLQKVMGLLGTAISFIIFGLLLIPNIFTENVLASESYFMLAVWSLLGIVYYWYIFAKDNENRFGKSTIMWIMMLFILFFATNMWMRLSADERIGNVIGEEPIIDSFLIKNSLIQMLVVGIALIILFRLFSIMLIKQKKIDFERIQATERDKAKTSFLSNMSHDIRTPMNAIMGYTDLAMMESGNEVVQDYLKNIKISSEHLLSLINNVLEMSRIESGKMELNLSQVNLCNFIDELETMFKVQAEGKNQTIERHIDIVHENVMADKLRLSQVLINIISNAIKYTGENGKISISVEETQSDVAGIAQYIFSVKDNGIGMSSEFLEKLFIAFERGTASGGNVVQGTGLGMTIASTIVDLMGGRISVESAPDKGSEFTVNVSFKIDEKVKTVQSEQNIDDYRANLTGKRILVVDDIEINRRIIKKLLVKYDMTVDEASDGKEAVDMVSNANTPFDLVIMDVHMPVMDGLEATGLIRQLKDDKRSKVPILAVTADAFEEDRKKALEAGMDGHIAKPINIDNLLIEINQAIIE